ncbi:MAG: metallophosphoesterase [Oscillospiraceae bacterium]|nr:metallophosphoesterase [Oscillospiraceae bacterium]
MKVLIVSDEEDSYLWDFYRPGNLDGVDLILSAGDLKASYLSFLVTMANRPLLYIHGNHDTAYLTEPPEGCECIEDRLVTVGGLRILGLGGTLRWGRPGPLRYTEKEMEKRIRKLRWKLHRARGVDIVLTHAPPRGYGDLEDPEHQGFEAFLPLLEKWKPKYLIHGHIHQRYTANASRIFQCGETTVLNANGKYLLEL